MENNKKWIFSAIVAVLFAIISSALMYKFVNFFTSKVGVKIANDGCPNYGGWFLHTIVFFFLVRIFMEANLVNF